MTILSVWDHLFAIAVFVAYPVIEKLNFPAAMRKVREGGECGKIAVYRQTMLTTAAFAVILGAMWVILGRDWGELGVRVSTPAQLIAGLALSFAVLLLTVVQFRAILKSESPSLGGHSDDLEALMPRSEREQKWFRAVSSNAGVMEEFIYRGFLIWYLTHFVDLVWASIISVALFTLAHAYQGIRQVPGLALISTVMVGLYLLSGSLLLPILLHAAFDMLQGHYVARVLNERQVSLIRDSADFDCSE